MKIIKRTQTIQGYIRIKFEDNTWKDEHIHIAEKAYGGLLPSKARVHHVNNNPTDNSYGNLVICDGQRYHKLIHDRSRELELPMYEGIYTKIRKLGKTSKIKELVSEYYSLDVTESSLKEFLERKKLSIKL